MVNYNTKSSRSWLVNVLVEKIHVERASPPSYGVGALNTHQTMHVKQEQSGAEKNLLNNQVGACMQNQA